MKSLIMLALKSRFGAVQVLFCGFFDHIIEKRSNAELYLLLPEHQGEKCREYCGSIGGGTNGDAGVGGGGDAYVIFGLRTKRKGLDDLFMLLPLNS